MAEQLGRMTAELGELVREPIDHLVDLINKCVAPAIPVTAEQVHIA